MEINWNKSRGETMKRREKNGVPYLSFPSFEGLDGFYHGFSTRLGGVSQGIFSSMNLSFSRGDEEKSVAENYRRISAAMGFPAESIVCACQTHTTNIRKVTGQDRGKGLFREMDYGNIDGLITDEPGVTLTTFYADCVPLFFIDPVHRAVGLSHSGWRGTVKRMGARTLEAMAEAYGTQPQEVYAAIGPSICQKCYEVSQDVAEAFREAFPDHREEEQLLYRKENGKYQMNLWRANEIVLLEAGVPEKQVSFPGICTCCNPHFLFSHRASRGKRGNLAAFLGICSQ